MKTEIKILAVSLVFSFSQIGNAQNTIQINKQDGSKVNTTISDVRKLTFPAGNLAITKYDGSVITYVLTDVKYINFASVYTSIPSVSEKNVQKLHLYPNPVVNELYVNFDKKNMKPTEILVTNTNGVVLFSQNITPQSTIHFDVSALPMGVYFCIVKSNGKTLVGKFIK